MPVSDLNNYTARPRAGRANRSPSRASCAGPSTTTANGSPPRPPMSTSPPPSAPSTRPDPTHLKAAGTCSRSCPPADQPAGQKILYDAQFTLPDDALMLDITAPANRRRRLPPAQHAQPARPLRRHHGRRRRSGLLLQRGSRQGVAARPAVLRPRAPSPARSFPPGPALHRRLRQRHLRRRLPAGPRSPAIYTSTILQYTWLPRYIAAAARLPDAWDAPFLYEDRRHLFYVTTTEHLVPVWRFPGFGILVGQPGPARPGGRSRRWCCASRSWRPRRRRSSRSAPPAATRPRSSATSRPAPNIGPPWPCRRRSPTRAS